MMEALERARQMRRAVELWAWETADEQAAQIPSLFPTWEDGAAYDVGDRVQYMGLLYKCLPPTRRRRTGRRGRPRRCGCASTTRRPNGRRGGSLRAHMTPTPRGPGSSIVASGGCP